LVNCDEKNLATQHGCRRDSGHKGCQMVCFQTKNLNLGKFWRALEWKILHIFYDRLEYFTAVWYNVWPFGIVCGHLVYFYVLVCLDLEKSGNLGGHTNRPWGPFFKIKCHWSCRCLLLLDMQDPG
jgi:hypothetical protein